MADANVVLKISSDVGNAITGLKSFVDLVGMAIGKISDFAKENDIFVNAMRRSAVDITEADNATSGLIDTTALYTQQVKLAQAGVKLNEKQYRAMAVASAELGKVTGDATGEFKRLTEGVAKGSTRALKQLGIDLENTEDLTLAQAEAVEKLTEKYGEATVEVESLSEGIYVFNNNLDTAIGLLWKSTMDFTDFGTSMNEVNKEFGKANAYLADWPELIFSVDMAMSNLAATLRDLVKDSWIAGAIAEAISFWGGEGKSKDDIARDIDESSVLMQNLARQKAAPERAARLEREKKLQERIAELAAQKGTTTKGRGRGRGGRGKGSVTDPAAEREAAIQEALGGPRDDPFYDILDEYQYGEGLTGGPGLLGAGDLRGPGMGTGAGVDIYGQLGGPDTAEEIQKRNEAEAKAHQDKIQRDKEAQDAYVERWNINTNISQTWGDAWTSAAEQVDAKMSVVNMTMGAFEDATRQVVTTIAQGGDLTVKGMAKMVKGIALNIGIEAQIQMLMNTAKAIAEGVSSWGASPRVEGFAAAAAAYQATAIGAFAIAGGSGAIAKNLGGGKGSKNAALSQRRSDRADYIRGQESDYSSGMISNGGGGDTNITITLEGDADGLFRAMVDKNQEVKRAGEDGM